MAQNAKQPLIANLETGRLGDAVARYFDPVQPFAGRTFDSLGDNPRDKIVADDLLAVTLLDVRWTPLAVRRLLYDQTDEISKLLGEIDDKTELGAPDQRQATGRSVQLWEWIGDEGATTFSY